MKRYEEALTDFNRLIGLDSGDKRAITRRGFVYRSMARYREALTDLNQAIELDPDYKEAIRQRGEVYLLLKQYDQALQNFKTAMDTEANDWCHYCQALAYRGLSQAENAKTDLIQAIQIAKEKYKGDTDNYGNAVNLALYYIFARNHSKAKQLYQEVVSKEVPLLYIHEAISDLQDLLTIFPSYPHAQEMEGFLQSVLSQRQRRITPE